MRVQLALSFALVMLSACTSAYERAPATSYASYGAPPPPPSSITTTSIAHAPLSESAAKIQVFTDAVPPKPCEVVGVLDFHTDEDSEDKGFDQLRAKAAELGADAVISADFEHGAEGEKSHLSGVAVRYKVKDERPYTAIARIDIPTPEDAEDKGFETMRTEAAALGADEVINVRFEHGKEGEMSHLTGLAIRFKAN